MLNSYPSEWELFREAILKGDDEITHPAKTFAGRGIPFAVLKRWFDAGVANELRLYRETLQTFRLDFKCLSFDSEGNETWKICSSESFDASTYEAAEQVLELVHLGVPGISPP